MCIIALVGVAQFVDVYVMHTGDIFRTAISLYYIGNEGISLLENMGNLGVPLSPKLKNVLEQIKIIQRRKTNELKNQNEYLYS